MPVLIVLFVLLFQASMLAQSGASTSLEGHFTSMFEGDHITLDLQRTSGQEYSGLMKDSYQTYNVLLRQSGDKITGTATESTLNLTFEISGIRRGQNLDLSFTLDFNGARNSMDLSFTKQGGSASDSSPNQDVTPTKLSFPQGATHPAAIAGTWMKEELYQSGYGDNFMGAGFTQKMTFFPDGHIAEGASSSYMSGSYYSGQSYGDGDGVIPGLGWYTIGKTFYIQLTENGKTQNIPLGTFYVEGNNMMITASSGDKLLLTRSN